MEDDRPDVFVVGVPRSGTTWVQAVLSSHCSAVTTVETDVFTALDGAVRSWGAKRGILPDQHLGLIGVIDRESLMEWAGSLWWRIRSSLVAAHPEVVRVVEKTPNHLKKIDLIRELYGNRPVRFVIVIRDPVDVVRSVIEANMTLPGVFPRNVKSACLMIERMLSAGIAMSRPEDTIFVRYEDLKSGWDEWRDLLEFVEMEDLEPVDLTSSPSDISAGRVVISDGNSMVRADALTMWKGHSWHTRTSHRPLSKFERRYVEWRCRAISRRFGYGWGRERLRIDDKLRILVLSWRESAQRLRAMSRIV